MLGLTGCDKDTVKGILGWSRGRDEQIHTLQGK
jgi:hypothetical protein